VVCIGEGKRHRPRLLGNRLVAVDAGPLPRDVLFEAIALANDIEMPDVERAAARPEAPAGPQADADSSPAEDQRVLVAEDSDINQKVIRRQLAMLGLQADLAGNGVEALALWRSRRYGLLLTDLQMPAMDGYELTAAIRREETGDHRLPIVALTANALAEEKLRCARAGIDDCLTKPLRLDQLAKSLAQWLHVRQH
jgi:CheY-like chemotaxis protein